MTYEVEPAYFVVPRGLHPATAKLVADFATALSEKLYAAQEKYGHTDEWLLENWETECRHELMRHVLKGDPLDVAAYAAFCWFHRWPSYPDPQAPEKFAAWSK